MNTPQSPPPEEVELNEIKLEFNKLMNRMYKLEILPHIQGRINEHIPEDHTLIVFQIPPELETLLLRWREAYADKARIEELENLMKKHTRTYRQTVTDNNGDVYIDDTHSYISKYETQERISALHKQQGDK